MITWLISVDISLIYHQIGVFHLKVVEEFVHQPNDLVSETQRSSTLASGQGSQAKPKPLSNFPLLVEMFAIHEICVCISMRSPGKDKTTRGYFATEKLGSDHFLECSTHVIVIGVYCFCSETFCISPGQVFISNNHNGKSRHVIKRHIMTWYCRPCTNLIKATSFFLTKLHQKNRTV